MDDGDTLFVTRIDRLARSLTDLQDVVRELNDKAFFDMLGVFAEFETNLHRERQLEDIAAAKARGVFVEVDRSKSMLVRCNGCTLGPTVICTADRHRPG